MKPREKLAIQGIKGMTDAELLALIFRCGNRKESVHEISQRIINEIGIFSLRLPNSLIFCKSKLNLNRVHASQLLAAVELGRRMHCTSETTLNKISKIENYVQDMKYSKKEVFRGLYVSSSLDLVADEVVSIGSLDKNIIHPREVFKPALVHSAYGVFLIHNHPSGNPQPSDEDIKATIQLSQAAAILQIKLLDHLIIAKQGIFSFYKSGLLS